MTTTNTKLISVLDKLETLWADDEQRLNIASEFTDPGSQNESILNKMASVRDEFQEQVQERIQTYGNAPPSGVSIRRRIRKVLIAAETAIRPDSLSVNLEECLEGTVHIKNHLTRLDLSEFPKSIARLFKYQIRILEQDLKSLRKLYNAHTGQKFSPIK